LVVGVVPLNAFEYSEIRSFAKQAIKLISRELPEARHIAMTIHGVGTGLDERESFLAQLGGIAEAVSDSEAELYVSIVERDPERAERLRKLLDETWPSSSDQFVSLSSVSRATQEITAGVKSNSKAHVFVAMPFSKDLEDVFIFGIQGPINRAGYLCERVDMLSFTGDILERIKSRIETAALVVADLTGANPNVYLEVGYAWGKNRPTLLLSRKTDDLKFDVRGQRCLVYDSIVDLSKKLQQDLAVLVT
jgi:hypothetical protein